jgi:Tfp pilus assembly protein PilX
MKSKGLKGTTSNQRGMATIVAILMVGMLTLLGLAAMMTSNTDVHIAGNEFVDGKAFYSAEAGLDLACAAIRTQYEATNKPPTSMPSGTDSMNSCAVTYTTVDDGPAEERTITTGILAGLHAWRKSFDVTSTAVSKLDEAKQVLTQTFETNAIPLFQYGVFYNGDLEISPGTQTTFLGRVHTNGDMYLQSSAKLFLESYVTAAGNIYHGPKIGATVNGDVQVKNQDGNLVSMKDGTGWLDAREAWWKDSSLARWSGRVQDISHGQTPLDVPLLNGATDIHSLIEPASGNPNSYENNASLKIVNNRAYHWEGGSWVERTTEMTSLGIITYRPDQFTDEREGQKVDVTDLDLGALYASVTYVPSNGVIYFSDNVTGATEYPALRLTNATTLGASLTIASANPVYTLGNFNSVTKKPAAILCDALTILSGNWDDTKSALPKNNRAANNTTVNCSFLTGTVPTTATVFGGGFENLPHLLESWTGKTLKWQGSAGSLWDSRQAVGPYSTIYYDAPNRNWNYDSDLDDLTNMPPETPCVRFFRRTGWKQQDVGYTNVAP